MLNYQAILEKAAFSGNLVEITTKSRGIVVGEYTGVDEYDTDETRLGYFLQTGEHEEETVYLDEIVDIKVISAEEAHKPAV
jgi:hypothetical protein